MLANIRVHLPSALIWMYTLYTLYTMLARTYINFGILTRTPVIFAAKLQFCNFAAILRQRKMAKKQKTKKITYFVGTFGPIIIGVRVKIPKLMYVRANILATLYLAVQRLPSLTPPHPPPRPGCSRTTRCSGPSTTGPRAWPGARQAQGHHFTISPLHHCTISPFHHFTISPFHQGGGDDRDVCAGEGGAGAGGARRRR